MPLKIRKNKNKETYKVFNANTGQVHSFDTTLQNAEKQIKLINMIDSKKKKSKK